MKTAYKRDQVEEDKVRDLQAGSVTILRSRGEWADYRPDTVAIEEPLEIRLGGKRFSLTMRTPGHDDELAVGFLLGEGFIDRLEDLSEIRRPRLRAGQPDPNAIDVMLALSAERMRARLKRNFVISSSCGVCGKTSIEALERRLAPLPPGQPRITIATLRSLGPRLREAQRTFEYTGGLHAAALFDESGELLVAREDVGRHNAVDKVVGRALMAGWVPLHSKLLLVSGRQSFEIVQKAAAAGIPLVAGISAPSSLAVELARSAGITLVGFLREDGFNVYSGAQRVVGAPTPPRDWEHNADESE